MGKSGRRASSVTEEDSRRAAAPNTPQRCNCPNWAKAISTAIWIEMPRAVAKKIVSSRFGVVAEDPRPAGDNNAREARPTSRLNNHHAAIQARSEKIAVPVAIVFRCCPDQRR